MAVPGMPRIHIMPRRAPLGIRKQRVGLKQPKINQRANLKSILSGASPKVMGRKEKLL